MQILFRYKNTSTNDFVRYALFLMKINHSSSFFAQFDQWNSPYYIFWDFFSEAAQTLYKGSNSK